MEPRTAKKLTLIVAGLLSWFSCDAQSMKPCISPKGCLCIFDQSGVVTSINCTRTTDLSLPLDLQDSVETLIVSRVHLGTLDTHFIQQCEDSTALPRLEKLTLSENNISTVDAEFFKCVPNLKELTLDRNTLHFNHLSFLNPPLKNLDSLQMLNLEDAFMKVTGKVKWDPRAGINVTVTHYTEIGWVFNNNTLLSNLQSLYLGKNNLFSFNTSDLCLSAPQLESLHLSHNNIQPGHRFGLNCFTGLKKLHLDDNGIERLPDNFIKQLAKSQLEELSLNENPWECDCHFNNTLQWLQNASQSSFVTNRDSLKCYVRNLQLYQPVLQVNASDLTCEVIIPLDKRLKSSYIVLGCVFAAIGLVSLCVLFLNRDKLIRLGKRCADPFLNYNPNDPQYHRGYSSVVVQMDLVHPDWGRHSLK